MTEIARWLALHYRRSVMRQDERKRLQGRKGISYWKNSYLFSYGPVATLTSDCYQYINTRPQHPHISPYYSINSNSSNLEALLSNVRIFSQPDIFAAHAIKISERSILFSRAKKIKR